MSKTAQKLNEVMARASDNEVCEDIKTYTLQLLAARIFSGFYF